MKLEWERKKIHPVKLITISGEANLLVLAVTGIFFSSLVPLNSFIYSFNFCTIFFSFALVLFSPLSLSLMLKVVNNNELEKKSFFVPILCTHIFEGHASWESWLKNTVRSTSTIVIIYIYAFDGTFSLNTSQ